MITQKELKLILNYNPISGKFISKVKRSTLNCGEEPGYKLVSGNTTYIKISIHGQRFGAHQLAFLYMTGKIPNYIDHRDRNGLNNAWKNLRKATVAQNAWNSKIPRTNKSGISGVFFMKNKQTNKWRAMINRKFIGYFTSKESAAEARMLAAKKYHGNFAS